MTDIPSMFNTLRHQPEMSYLAPDPSDTPPVQPSSIELSSQDTVVLHRQTHGLGTFSLAQIERQETQYPRISPDSTYTPSPSPNLSQHTIFTYEQTNHDDTHSGLNSGTVVLTYPCPHERAPCPRAPHENDALAVFGHYLLRTGGRSRFPRRSHRSFVHGDIYSLPYRAVDPIPFSDEEFARHWQATPLEKDIPLVDMEEEGVYEGAIYTVSTSPYSSEEFISRGTSIILNKKNSAYVRYFIMIRRHMNHDCSLIQVHAITHDNRFVRYDHPDWPAFYMFIPNHYCKVPMPKELVPFYDNFIKPPSSSLSTWWNKFKKIGRTGSSSAEEKKWDVEIIY